ncbi:hypothetical protein KQH81_07015 [Clostridium cadaveris]|uniref:hypothetical protein n=1 Tax=Clostridium cadaveris TaxID=1529 RepID=UPI001E54A57A|nr:hypothetical protein [Clostridium cadaveris]UFH66263.1 hypothetical protein KQH81_07015 [Clostridium cadaveris]
MKYEDLRKLINNVIENEFHHIQYYEEKDFGDTDKEQNELETKADEILEKLNKSVPEEFRMLVDEYSSAVYQEWVNLCKFYFKKGVISGTTNLNFLKDTNMMEYIE